MAWPGGYARVAPRVEIARTSDIDAAADMTARR